MKISSRVRVIILIPIIFGICVIIIQQEMAERVGRALDYDNLIVNITQKTTALHHLSGELARYPDERRVKKQWLAVYGSLRELVLQTGKDGKDSQATLAQLKKSIKLLGELHHSLLQQREEAAVPTPHLSERQERKVDRMLLLSQNMISDTLQLRQKSTAKLLKLRNLEGKIILFITLALVVILGLLAFIMGKRITKPLSMLEKSAEIIGSGDLTHRIGRLANDELGSLGLSLDEMTKQLKETLASRDLLNREVEERKRTEEFLRKSEARLAEAQQIAHVGHWEWDLNRDKLHWSDEVYRILGFRPREFEPTYEAFLRSVHPDDREALEKAVNKALKEGKAYNKEHRIVLPDGTERIVNEVGKVFYDDAPKPIRMMGTVLDITEGKRAEKELEQKRRLAAMGEMSAYIAHDIRNPLNNLGLSYELLKDSPAIKGNDREALLLMGKGIENLISISKDLLDYGRSDKLIKENFDCLALINELLTELDEKTGHANIEVIKKLPQKSSPLKADRVKIHQALLNILNNAIQSMAGGGRLSISAEERDGRLIIAVCDTGAGIKKKDLDKIFAPFFTTRKNGTGLGMAILKHFVDLHGGEVIVESEVGKGTTVTVALPVKP
ncbi:MAG: PAS domain-containing protein [Deltaproteobacteria bacterium]|nr:PAS domain-containing protein [Deltaproteobacteria bacterium]